MLDHEVRLKRPFPLQKLRWRRGQGGSGELVYITARDVMDRLDEVFGPEGWQTSYAWLGNRMICKIECLIDGDWIAKCDGADDTNIEGAKGGISDAFKRCGVMWGIFRYAYYKGAFSASKQPAEWATPDGFDKLMAKREKKSVEQWRAQYNMAASGE